MLQASCATLALLCSTSAVVAQNTTIIGGSGSSGVYVNEQLIGSVPAYSNGYSYGAQSAPSGYPGAGNNQYLNRPGNLLFPPSSFPHSQVTINNFADFQGSGYNQTAYAAQNNPQAYNSWQQRYGQNPYAQGGYPQQPGQTTGSSLYNPYGQPLVPLSQVSSTHVASSGQQPQYPSQVPAFSPQSQLLVPSPNGGNRVVQKRSMPATQAPVTQTASITPPVAPKVTPKKAEPVTQAQAPSSIIPPAPAVEETQPTKVEPVATPQAVAPKAPTVEETVKETTTAAAEGTTFSAPEPVTTAPAITAPAPAIETVTAEPVLTPPPVPEPTAQTAETDIPTAPTIAGTALTESTEELAPPPPPPANAPLSETAPVDVLPATEETAAITPSGELGPIQLLFEPSEADLSSEAKAQLNTLADQLLADESKIIQLLAYAGDSESNAQARRISLSRALAVRGVLMERGIPSTRMHVRALGNKAKKGNPDRVEIIPVQN